MRARRAALALIVLATASSCALIAGIEDIEITGGPDGGGGAAGGGAGGGGAGGDAAVDGGLNGPSCGQDLVCAPGSPVGWKFVAFEVAAPTAQPMFPVPGGPPCPDGYSGAIAYHEGLDAGPANCPCACAPDASPEYSCTPSDPLNTFSFSYGTTAKPCQTSGGGPLCDCCNFGTVPPLNNASSALEPGITFSTDGGSCAVVATSVPSPTYAAAQVCSVEVDPLPSTSCPQGEVCARQTTAPYVVCVEAPVDPEGGAAGEACPPGYPNQHVLPGGGPFDVSDTRGCAGTCACGADVSCGTPTLNFNAANDGGNCGTTAASIPADGTCQSVPSGTYESITFDVPLVVNGPCAVTVHTLAPEGGVTVNAARTVCCP